MPANRKSWIVAALVVVAVGFLVVRSLRSDSATRTDGAQSQTQVGDTGSAPPRRALNDSLRNVPRSKRLGSVVRAKMALKEKGFFNGELNGDINQELAEAVRKFQAANGLKPTGYLDKKTYSALGIEFGRRAATN